MYTIKNNSNKVIHIGTTALMPDHSMKATDAVCQIPAVKAFAKKGLLTLTAHDQPAPVAPAPQAENDAQNGAAETGNAEGGAEEGKEQAAETPKAKGARPTTKKAEEGTEE